MKPKVHVNKAKVHASTTLPIAGARSGIEGVMLLNECS